MNTSDSVSIGIKGSAVALDRGTGKHMRSTQLKGWAIWLAIGMQISKTLGVEVPVETFFRNFQYAGVRISPDGSCMGVVAPVGNRVGLAIVDFQTGKANWAFSDSTADVEWFQWANTNRLVFGLGRDGNARSGLLAVNKNSSKPVTLVRVGDSRTRLLKVLPDSSEKI